MSNYKIFNINTNHTFYQSNNLKQTITFYHKISKRKNSTIILLDNFTGEIIKMK